MTACTSLPNLPAPLGAVGVGFFCGFSAVLCSGDPSCRRSCVFLLSSSPGPDGPRCTGWGFFGSICCQQEVVCELLSEISCAKTEFSPKIKIIQPKLSSCALCTCIEPGQALLGFSGAVFMNPHHNPALNVYIPCPKLSIQSYLGTRQCSSLRKSPPWLEGLPNGDRAPSGLAAHKQEKLF